MTMLALEGLIVEGKQLLNDPASLDKALDFFNAMEEIVKQLIDMNSLKMFDKARMPYTDAFRYKLRVWQSLIVFVPLFEPKIYADPDFVKLRPQGNQILKYITDEFWKYFQLHSVPAIRQYMEIFAIKFTTMYPELSVEQHLLSTVLDTNIKNQVSSSYLLVSGYILDSLKEPGLKKRVFDKIVGFCTSMQAHPRSIAQYFVLKTLNDPVFETFVEPGLEVIIDYMRRNKDTQKILEKFTEAMSGKDKYLSGKGDVCSILCERMDEFGEYVSEPFIETLKGIVSH